MRAWYVSRRNSSILDAKLMVLFAASLVMILVWLMPREETFRSMLANGEADRVSLSYARLLLRISPEDAQLRQLLGQQYYQLGEFENAWDILKHNNEGRSVFGIKVLQKITYSYHEGPIRSGWQQQLEDTLEKVVAGEAIDMVERAELAKIASSLNRPRMAALLRERIFEVTRTDADLLATATAWLAADNAARAFRLVRKAGTRNNKALLKMAIRAALAADESGQALAIIDDYLTTSTADNAQLLQFIQVALAANQTHRVRDFLARVDNISTLSLAEATQLSTAAIASGELQFALSYLEHAASLDNTTPALTTRIAQVYEWNGQTDRALNIWLKLANQQADGPAMDRAWRLSQALYQYTNVSLLLTRLSRARRLTDEEVLALRTAFEQSGEPDEGTRVLQNYVNAHVSHDLAWRELITLRTNNQRLSEATDTWQAYSQNHLLEVVDYSDWADLLWRQYRTDEALELLLKVDNADDQAYWQQVAAYAWFLDDFGNSRVALEKLLALQPTLNEANFNTLIRTTTHENPQVALEHAITAYRSHTEKHQFLLQALRLAVQIKDSERSSVLFAIALDSAHPIPYLTEQADFWALHAQYLQQVNEPVGAKRSIQKALALAPKRADLRSGHLWLLLHTQDLDELTQALADYTPDAQDQPLMWAALASGFAALNQQRQAGEWYGKAVTKHVDDVGLLLAYSGTLDSLGHRDPAYRVRRYALKTLLREARSSGQLEPDMLIWASRDMLSGPDQKAVLRSLMAWSETSPKSHERRKSSALQRFELADALRRSHYSAARYWLNKGVPSNDSEALAVAQDTHDKETLSALLEHKNPQLRTQAALALGNQRLATSFAATNSLSASSSPSARFGSPHNGWRLQSGWSRQGRVTTQRNEFLGLATLFDRQYELELSVDDIEIDGVMEPERYTETAINASADFDNYVGTGTLEIGALTSDRRSFVGGAITQNYRLDRRNAFTGRAMWRQKIDGGGLAQALLDRSGLELNWSTSPAQRHSINSALNWHQFRDQSGRVAGNTKNLAINHNFAWLRSGVSADIQTGVQAVLGQQQGFNPSSVTQITTPGSTAVPQSMQRFSIGATLRREDPGELGWQRSGPHYRLGGSVGYQWPERQATFEADFALGISLFGRDELSIRASFSSALQTEASEKGIRAQLGYVRYLDW